MSFLESSGVGSEANPREHQTFLSAANFRNGDWTAWLTSEDLFPCSRFRDACPVVANTNLNLVAEVLPPALCAVMLVNVGFRR
jgi:hypothetical protein